MWLGRFYILEIRVWRVAQNSHPDWAISGVKSIVQFDSGIAVLEGNLYIGI